MEISKGELRRLQSGLGAEDGRQRPLPVRVEFTAEDPSRVIAHARAVLTSVLQRTDDWPGIERWPELLPTEFVRRCAPEPTEPEPRTRYGVRTWLQRRMATTSGRNSPDGQGPWDGHGPWALSAWLHFFDPTAEGMGDDRSWWWWDAGFDERHTGWIEVVTSGWPFGSGSLSWLITAGGGGDLKYPS